MHKDHCRNTYNRFIDHKMVWCVYLRRGMINMMYMDEHMGLVAMILLNVSLMVSCGTHIPCTHFVEFFFHTFQLALFDTIHY